MTAIAAAICKEGIVLASDGKAQGFRLDGKQIETEDADKMYQLSNYVWLLACGGGPENYTESLEGFVNTTKEKGSVLDLAYCKSHLPDYLEDELGGDILIFNSPPAGLIVAGYVLSDNKIEPEIMWCDSMTKFQLHPAGQPYKAAGVGEGKICEARLEGLYKSKEGELPTFDEVDLLLKTAIKETAKKYPTAVNDNVTIELLSLDRRNSHLLASGS